MSAGIPKVASGARAILKIDDNVFAYATSVSYTVDTDWKPVMSIDNSLPEELIPTNIQVSITCTNFRIPKESASVLALQPTILNHLHQGYISVEIRDRGTNDILLFVPKAMITRREGGVGARSLAHETWTMVGIGYWDERPPEKAKEAQSATQKIGSLLGS